MKGLLIHRSRSIKKILQENKLISKKDLPETPEWGFDGPEDVPLIFITLMFEDKITLVNKQSRDLFSGSGILLDPQLLEDYGNKKFKLKKAYKPFFNRRDNFEIPSTKLWFNTDWRYGVFNTTESKNLSIDYDPTKSIERNIKIFHDAKVRALENQKLKYDTRYIGSKHSNEIVIYDDTIDISKYVLGIYIENDKLRETLKKTYPQYSFMDKKETNRFIKNYFNM